MIGSGARSRQVELCDLLPDGGRDSLRPNRTEFALSPGLAHTENAAMSMNFTYRNSDGSPRSSGRLAFSIPPSARSRLRGNTGAQRQLALLLRLPTPSRKHRVPGTPVYAALRVTVSLQILFAKYSEKISPEPP